MTTGSDPAVKNIVATHGVRIDSRLPRVLCVTPDVFNNISHGVTGNNLFVSGPEP